MPELAFPLAGITSRYAKGADSVDDPGLTTCETLPLDEAISECWNYDAHLMPYQLVDSRTGHPYDSWPRLNKSVLSGVRGRGGEVQVTALVIDWDTPSHAPIDGPTRDSMEALLASAHDSGLALALGWTWLYVTRGGLRLVFVLSRPVLPEEFEPLYLGACRDFLAHGIKVDSSCHPWNWTFRLPRVTREPDTSATGLPIPSEKTWLASYFDILEQPQNRLDPGSIVPAEHALLRSFSGSANGAASGPIPTPERCRAWLECPSEKTGRMLSTPWAKEAKSRMRGRSCSPALFEAEPLAWRGTRNARIQEVAGELAAMLSSAPDACPEAIYALADDALTRLNEDDPRDPEDFRETGWRAVNRYFAAEQVRIQEEEKQRREEGARAAEVQGTLFDRVLAGVKTWCDAPEVWASDEQAAWWVSRHAIASWKDSCYCLGPDGFFDPVPVRTHLLPARLRELGMHLLVPLEKIENGRTTARSSQDLLNAHAFVAAQCEGGINLRGAHLRDASTQKPTIVLPMFSRKTDLEPRFDADVDTWLQLFGGLEYPRLCTWIGHALAFEDGPIAALSIKGPPGLGKKLLYVGLSECIDTETFATGAEFGQYQDLLMRTPFLVVNEGLHAWSRNSQHPADVFRAYVSGDPIRIRALYTPPVIVRNPVRILFLANNIDVVQELVGQRDLAPDDRAALAVRLLHIVAGEATPGWIRSRGGLRFTRGWIRGDAGEASDYRIARHFMWLHAHRPAVPDGNRLLVEGNADSELIRQMTTRSGSSPIVIEALIRMVEAESPVGGMAIEGSKVYVTSKAVVDFYRSQMQAAVGARLNTGTVGTVLKGLLVPDSDTVPKALPTAFGSVRARWREIDAALLLQEAIEHGYVARRLEELALGQRSTRERMEQAALEIQRAYSDQQPPMEVPR